MAENDDMITREAEREGRRLAGAAPLEDRIWALIEEFEKQHPFQGEDGGSNDRALLFNLISQHFGPKPGTRLGRAAKAFVGDAEPVADVVESIEESRDAVE